MSGVRGRLLVVAAVVAGAAVVMPPAEAVPVAQVPPIGAGAGRSALPVTCAVTLPDAGGAKIADLGTTVDLQGVAPTRLRPGRQFALTQAKGGMVLPAVLPTLAGFAGIGRADANLLELTIGAAGATPESINVVPGGRLLPDIPLVPGRDLDVRVPEDGSTFADIGPFTAPAGGVVRLQFRHALIDITLKADWGLRLRVRADCRPVSGNALLSIAVGGEPGGAPLAFHDVPMDQFPPMTAGNQVGTITSPYRCTVLGAPLDVGFAVSATTPSSVGTFGSITFTGTSGALVIPGATVDQLLASGFSTVSGRLTTLNLEAEGGSPKVVNALGQGVTIPETDLVANTDVVLPLPATAGPWRPDFRSPRVKITLGAASADLVFDGGFPTRVDCAKPGPEAILLDAPVTG